MQGNVSISTKEEALDIIYGNQDFVERLAARTSVKYIYTDICDLQRSHIRFGFHLYEFRSNEYHKDFGYLTFEEFCDKNIGLDKGTISRCINIYLRFAKKENGRYLPTMFIDDRYADYSYSQLCEMLPLDDDDLKHIKPDMTVKQIREYKNSKKTGSKVHLGKSCDVAIDRTEFDLDRFNGLKGIVAWNYVKNCVPVGRCPVFLFDADGRPLESGFDILFNGRDGIVLRRSEEGVG